MLMGTLAEGGEVSLLPGLEGRQVGSLLAVYLLFLLNLLFLHLQVDIQLLRSLNIRRDTRVPEASRHRRDTPPLDLLRLLASLQELPLAPACLTSLGCRLFEQESCPAEDCGLHLY